MGHLLLTHQNQDFGSIMKSQAASLAALGFAFLKLSTMEIDIMEQFQDKNK